MDVKQLREDINKLGTDMTALLETAKAENRALKADEAEQFDRMDADREAKVAEERRWLKAQELESGTGRRTAPSPVVQPETRRSDTKITNADRTNAMLGWLLPSEHRTAEMRSSAERMGVSIDGKQYVLRLPSHALRSPRRDDVKQWEERIIAGAGGSPEGGGQFTVADETMGALEQAMLAFGGMRQVATVMRTSTGADLPIPTTNDTSNTGAIVGEMGEHTELDINFNQLVLEAYKYTSRLVKVSVEFLQDTSINSQERIGQMLGERIGRATNAHFTTGDGSGKPLGITQAATASGVTTAAANSVSYDDIIDLVHSVDPAYRTGARFMFSDGFLKLLKKLKVPQFSGDSNGYPLWRPGFATGEPDTIDGYGYVVNQNMPTTAAGNRAAVFGALSKYIVRDVRDITLMRLDERFAEYGAVAFLAFSRHDGDLLDAGTHPVKYLLMGN